VISKLKVVIYHTVEAF